ncbi:hypothetical protein BH20ACT21_BH20ACT21_22040 [soil metagenome]
MIETSGFTLLRDRARDLQKGTDLSEAQAITKAAEQYPDLAASHMSEMRSFVG